MWNRTSQLPKWMWTKGNVKAHKMNNIAKCCPTTLRLLNNHNNFYFHLGSKGQMLQHLESQFSWISFLKMWFSMANTEDWDIQKRRKAKVCLFASQTYLKCSLIAYVDFSQYNFKASEGSFVRTCMCVCMPSHSSHIQLFVTPWTVACLAPMSIGILQARIVEWVSMPSSWGPSWPRDLTYFSIPLLHRQNLPGILNSNAYCPTVVGTLNFFLESSLLIYVTQSLSNVKVSRLMFSWQLFSKISCFPRGISGWMWKEEKMAASEQYYRYFHRKTSLVAFQSYAGIPAESHWPMGPDQQLGS